MELPFTTVLSEFTGQKRGKALNRLTQAISTQNTLHPCEKTTKRRKGSITKMLGRLLNLATIIA